MTTSESKGPGSESSGHAFAITEQSMRPGSGIAPKNSDDCSEPADTNELHGVGYEFDPKVRREIELYAVGKACAFYKNCGYSVAEKGKPFDLLCEKPGEAIHVEVKGSRATLDAIIVATNQVKDARSIEWRSDLFLVDCIVLESSGDGNYKLSGGRSRIATNWQHEDKGITPMQYRYMLSLSLMRSKAMSHKIIISATEPIVCPKCSHHFPLDQGITRQTIERYEPASANPSVNRTLRINRARRLPQTLSALA